MSYKAEDEITITFAGLKNAQNEAFKNGIEFAASQISYLLDENVTKGKIIHLLTLISNTKLYSIEEEDDEMCDCDTHCDCEVNCGAEECEGY